MNMWTTQIASAMTRRPEPVDEEVVAAPVRRDTRNLEAAWAASKVQRKARVERLYATIRKGEISTPALIERLGMSNAAACQMLRELSQAGRIKSRKSERIYYWSAT
jgi:predicted Rossmann fold nucleotide-binding protein DprA/Smf involved in DNA uptake